MLAADGGGKGEAARPVGSPERTLAWRARGRGSLSSFGSCAAGGGTEAQSGRAAALAALSRERMTTTDVVRTGNAAAKVASGTRAEEAASGEMLQQAHRHKDHKHASASPPHSGGADGMGVSNVSFAVNNSAQTNLQGLAAPGTAAAAAPAPANIPALVLLKGPAWIALMTLDERAGDAAGAEGTKSNCGDGVVDDESLVGKLVLLKRIVLQAKVKPHTQRSSNGAAHNYTSRSESERAMIRDLSGNRTRGDAALAGGGGAPAAGGVPAGAAAAAASPLQAAAQAKKDRRKKDASGEDSNNVRHSCLGEEEGGARADGGSEEVQKMAYNDQLQLHLPDQTGSRKRARRRGPRSRSSGYRGVTCYRRTGRWEAHIWEERRQIHLGSFSDPADAARTYDRAALRFRGLDADLNFEFTDYRNDPWLKAGGCLNNDEFVKLLRSHDKVRGGAAGTLKGSAADGGQMATEQSLRSYVLKFISRTGLPEYHTNAVPPPPAPKPKKKALPKADRPAKRPKPIAAKDGGHLHHLQQHLAGDVLLHRNPHAHAHATVHHYPVAPYASAAPQPQPQQVDHGAMFLGVNHHVNYHHHAGEPAMAVQNVPMMHFWNVGTLDDHANNGSIEFLAVAGDSGHDDEHAIHHHHHHHAHNMDLGPDLVFGVVDPGGMHSSGNNSPISHSGGRGMAQVHEYVDRHA